MLSDRCLSVGVSVCATLCLVTFVYCRQMVAWFKMPLGTEAGLGSGHTVLDGKTALPHEKGHSSFMRFPPYFYIRFRRTR